MKKIIFILSTTILLLSVSFSLLDAQECFTIPSNGSYGNNEYTNEPINVNLHLIIVKRLNGSGGWDNDDISNFIDLTKSVFNQHDIYFNICIDEKLNDYYYDNQNLQVYLQQEGYNDEKCIYGVIYDSGGGQAPSIPGKLFYAGIPEVAIHELGHALGLDHTFENGYSEDAPYDDSGVLVYGANSHDTGDMVYDTPADISVQEPDIYINTPDCTFKNPQGIKDNYNNENGNEYIDPEGYLAHNIMEYYNTYCRSLVSPGQGVRIHSLISEISEVLTDIYEPKPVFNFDYYIQSNTTWDNYDRIINGNIYVNNSAFTISNSNIHFTKDKQIILNGSTSFLLDNSELNVNNSSICNPGSKNSTWGGILCDYGLSTGFVVDILNGSYIKNAEKGVSTISFNADNTLWLHIFDSHFIDNKTSVDILNARGSIYLKDSKFWYNRTDDVYYRPQLKIVHSSLFLRNSEVINKNLSIIENTSFQSNDLIYGIELYKSHMLVHGETEISNWIRGVNKQSGGGIAMYNTTLENNSQYGIYANKESSILKVKESNFINNRKAGVVLIDDDGTSLIFEKNDFYCTNGISDDGIRINTNQVDDHSFFYNNRFQDIDGSGIAWINENTSENSFALFNCNIMENENTQLFTLGNINSSQAGKNTQNQITSAGNTYEPAIFFNFFAEASYNIDYYYQTANEYPVKKDGIIAVFTMNEADCSENYFDDNSGSDSGDGDTNEYDDRYTEEVEKKTHVEDTIATCGGGNAVWVVIDEVTIATAPAVADMLTDLGPWLTVESAEEFVDNANMFTSAQIVSVLSASPDVFMNTTVYQFVFGENSPLTSIEQDVMRTGLQTTTEKTKQIVKLNHTNLKIEYIINKAIEKVLFPANGMVDYTNLRMWMNRRGTYKAKIDIADTYLSQGNFTGSVSYLQQLLTDNGLSSDQCNDINNYISINQLLGNVYQDQRYEGTLTTQEISSLEGIANSDTRFAKSKARGILEYFYGYTFEENPQSQMTSTYKTPRSDIALDLSKISINPNPNNGLFEVRLDDFDTDITITNVKILTVDGKTIYDKSIKDTKVNIGLENVIPGIYMYNITDSNKKLHTGKLIVK